MSILLIVESPSKAKTIESYLGAGYKVAASVGHIRDLPEHEMGVEPPDFRPQYVWTERGKDVVSRLKKLAAEAEDIFLASDLDREGEAIAWHLQQVLGLKNPKRIVFNKITPSALKAALAAPRGIDVKMVAAQEARRILDRFVGYMVSPQLSELLGERDSSAGRVQSVAVRLVVEREREIRSHKPITHFGAELSFSGGWRALWQIKQLLQDGQEYWTDKEFAEKVAGIRILTVTSYEESESKSAPPAPFITSTLQQAASNALGLRPKAAMQAAQKLYEQGAITYMRTDSPNLSDEAISEISEYCRINHIETVQPARTWSAKADAQGAHEAIRPTHFDVLEAGETDEEKRLYKMIWKRTICSQLEDARFAVRTAVLTGAIEKDSIPVMFLARGKTLISPGWKSLSDGDDTEENDEKKSEADNPIPQLAPGQTLTAESGKLVTAKTKPPARFSEATLVKELEKKGIGRPSTYAAIIEKISNTRGYVRLQGKTKFFEPTERGEQIVDAMISKFTFLEYEFTRDVEEQLDAIAVGKANYKAILSVIHNRLAEEIGRLRSNSTPRFPCPECGRGLVKIPGKGKKGDFWGCAGHKEGCSQTFPDDNGQPGAKRSEQVSEHSCTVCSKPLVHRFKEGSKGYDFWGCTGYKEGCKQTYPNKSGIPDFEARSAASA